MTETGHASRHGRPSGHTRDLQPQLDALGSHISALKERLQALSTAPAGQLNKEGSEAIDRCEADVINTCVQLRQALRESVRRIREDPEDQ